MRLLEALLTYLVTEGLVRRPSGPASALPPLLTNPRDGVPAPATLNTDLVLGAFKTGGIAPRPRHAELRKDIVDIWLRAKQWQQIEAFEEEQLRPALVDKVDWTMGGMHIGESLQWRELQHFSSDADGYTYISAYIFERRAS